MDKLGLDNLGCTVVKELLYAVP